MSASPEFQPYIADSERIPELTWSSVVLGSILGVVFGASSLYVFLKVGMTVSASIPVAVLSITIFRAFSKAFGTRRATILENNIVQTAGSAGESIAFGVGATMPALMILGYAMDPTRVLMVAVLGGMLGILMMIPLRRAFIVQQHGELKYPEGAACAKILIAGEQGGSSAQTVFTGFGMGFVYEFLVKGMKLWNSEPAVAITGIPSYHKAVVAAEVSPILLGVGYIIGTRTAAVMVGGGLLTSLVLVPLIAFFGEKLPEPLYPGTTLISKMAPGDVIKAYVRYIGAGAVAAGGIISMCRALPLIFGSISGGVKAMRSGGAAGLGRTERDLPIAIVFLGCLALVGVVAASDLLPTTTLGRVAGGLMILAFGFMFVTVSSRITGEIGSSSNPISGMTIATLLLTCLIFVLLGWIGPEFRVAALSIAGIVCVASSNGGTTSQDLKTGYLVGATPWKQQVAILVGAVLSALLIGLTLLALNSSSEVVTRKAEYLTKVVAPVESLTETQTGTDGKLYKVWRVGKAAPGIEPGLYRVDPSSGIAVERVDPGIGGVISYRDSDPKKRNKLEKFNPPQPALFATIIDGILAGQLPWALVILGAGLAVVVQLCGVSSLAFAVGVYLPLATTLPIFIGGLVRGVVDRVRKLSAEESDSSPAVLYASGLIAGGSLAGVLLSTLQAPIGVAETIKNALDVTEALPKGWGEQVGPAIVAFGVLIAAQLWIGLRSKPGVTGDGTDGDLARRGEISDGPARS